MPQPDSQSSSVPPLPQGYTLDSQASALPPLPAGYKLDSEASATEPQAPPGLLDRIKSEASAVYQHPGQAALGAVKAIPGLFQSVLPSAGTMQDPLLPQETKGPSKIADVYNKISGAVTQATTPQNEAQQGGAHAITAAALVAPTVAGGAAIGKAANASAIKEEAGKLFQSVAADANKLPVNLEASHDAAVRLMDWQKSTNPGPTVNKFLNRITSGSKGPLTYEEARDFQQLFSRMSVDETMKMPPPVKFQVQRLAAGLKQDIGNTAEQVGRAADYYKAMGDYAHAARLQEWYDLAKKYAVRGALAAAGGGLAAEGAKMAYEGMSK